MPSHRNRQVSARPVAAPKTEVIPEAPAFEAIPEIPAAEAIPEAPAFEAVPEIPAAEVIPEAPAFETVPEIPAAEAIPEAAAFEAISETPAAEELSEAPAAEAISETPEAEELAEEPTAEMVSETPAAEEFSEAPVAEVIPEATAFETISETPAAEELSEEPAAEALPETPAADAIPENPDAEEISEAPTAEEVPEDAAKETAAEDSETATSDNSNLEDLLKARQLTLEELEAKYQALLEENKALGITTDTGETAKEEAGAAGAAGASADPKPVIQRAPKTPMSEKAKETSFWLKLAGILLFVIVILLFIAAIVPSDKNASDKTPYMDQIRSQDVKETSDPQINKFFTEYYNALSSGNTTELEKKYDDPSKAHITTEVSSIVDKYDNLKVYTTQGIEEKDLVAFVSNDVHFANIKTTAPSVDSFYLKYDEDGSLKICAYMYTDQEMLRFMNLVSYREPIHSLLEDTDKKLQDVLSKDKDLNNIYILMQSMADKNWAQEAEEAAGADSENETTGTAEKK